MKIEVVIPTYMREEKLKRTIVSVKDAINQCDKSIEVKLKIFYSHFEEWSRAQENNHQDWVEHSYIIPRKEFSLPEFWNERLKSSDADAMVYLTDDILLNKYCLSIAAMEIQKMGFDGIIGFLIENILEPYQPCLAAFGIIGLKYADRFRDRRVFCPDYTSLYADLEVQRQAEALGRFKFHTACMLIHYHPSYTLGEKDMTHFHTRRNFDRDQRTYNLRLKRNLTWGITEELINA